MNRYRQKPCPFAHIFRSYCEGVGYLVVVPDFLQFVIKIIYMINEYKQFLIERLPESLEKLTENTPALWGIMGPQHMVEHVSGVFYISQKELGLTCTTREENLPKVKEFIWNDQPFPRSVRIVGIPKDQTLPLRYGSLDEAKEILFKSIGNFYQFFDQNPEATTMHPVFGRLNQVEWERIHWKHTTHHLRQFGLLD